MGDQRRDLIQGTLDLLILETLAGESLHGWGIAKRIQQASDDVLRVNQGSLYPALQRLKEKGLLRSRWEEREGGRPVKIYTLTGRGARRLRHERESWASLSSAVNQVLGTT